jgi:hypothetical protein
MSDVLRGCRQTVRDAVEMLEGIGRCLIALQGAGERGERFLSLKDQAQLLVDLVALDRCALDLLERLEDLAEAAGDCDPDSVAGPLNPDVISPLAVQALARVRRGEGDPAVVVEAANGPGSHRRPCQE